MSTGPRPTSTAVTAGGAERPSYVRRISFRFSGRGRYAACLAGHDHRPLAPELWDLTATTPRCVVVRTRDGETSRTHPVATDDGDILLCRIGDDGVHHLVLVTVPSHGADGDEPAGEHPLAAFRGRGLRVLPSPAPETAALAFEMGGDGGTTVWRLSGRAEPPQLVVRLPELVGGGVWLDEAGTLLALARAEPEAAGTVLDLSRGALVPFDEPAADEHVLLAAPRAGTLLTATRRDGTYRLGLRGLGDRTPTRFPERLNAIDGTVSPLALDPAGRRLALGVTRGVRSHLLLHDLVRDTSEEVDLVPGTLQATARWTDDALHLVHGAPDRPAGVVTVPDRRPPRAVRDHPRGGWSSARAESYDGPAGSVEAVVYGDPATSPQVVLALHGGPESAWQLAFDPLFQHLAHAGIAVVAPNQRGSTGYGSAHREAINGAWGGPDLEDVTHLGRVLAAARGPDRQRPMLYGASYGAYLALLAAARTGLWSRAAVVAPFLSGPALYEDGPPTVRALLDRLDGRREIHDEFGPRDLRRLAGRLRLPLLIVHGERDQVIPVTHSRRLRDLLAAHGRNEGDDLVYLEVAGAGHDPMSDAGASAVLDRVVGFLRAGPSGGP